MVCYTQILLVSAVSIKFQIRILDPNNVTKTLKQCIKINICKKKIQNKISYSQ